MRNTLEKQTLETSRLILRQWRKEDVAPFAEMNADRKVMQYFPETLSYEESAQLVERYQQHFDEYGFGLWAVEIKDQSTFAGFIGLAVPQFTAYFTPCVEIGWRLAAPHWNQGYATEGAQAALDFGFNNCNLKEIVSFTVPANVASRRVMEKIGMSYIDNFDHPAIPGDDPLSRHVLYRITKEERDALEAA
ncbi:GNAT family N-acetyltransferase [Gimesia algae]|uniref:Acetyltransferase (GNAT) family protein n=1 Tax=Gimesia algae TaxID=2527971 RepID=A0A517V6C2_9PLAN|nr:GNAT family N-acetyltransferase [Gimesia algae]QDT88557.1 Acetyltransferase (GNAT) family protein [Gimesia algae]